MRMVAWNIRAGGGRRVAGILAQIEAWSPDVVALSEFRGTAAGAGIPDALAAQGLMYSFQTTDPASPARNALLLASRWPLRPIRLRSAPADRLRWLCASVAAKTPITVAAVHFPNEVTGLKWPFMESVAALAGMWRRGPAVIIGDTNSGRPSIDEENAVFGPRYHAWFERMAACGWHDAFRKVHGERREFSWYSPNGGNGFRIDQAFVNRPLLCRLQGIEYRWGGPPGDRRDALSDHAALIVDFADQ
jgi:exodeoxyribonuclease III